MSYWTFFSQEAARGQSPLYERLSLGIGEDQRLQDLAAQVRDGQPHANILLGSVHALLLKGADHPLAEHYPSVRPGARPHGDPVLLFRDFVDAHEAALLPMIRSRVTNTNEVGRCTSVMPVFDLVARESGQGLHLIEIGPSAGFNLNFDRYGYQYKQGGAVALARGAADAPVTLSCEMRGGAVPTLGLSMPAILTRVGLELNPVDLNNAEDRLWLKALVWPELLERHARLDAAIRVLMEHPVTIRFGDALALLGPQLAQTPKDGRVVVSHTHVTYQFTPLMREQLDAILLEASAARPVARVSIEYHEGRYP
ncbi:MAG TPA: hypothetical protein DCL48_08215, partial [Alphaproteobacteria bacterium]|nr:hypothetical protein [Alphaproteobacteria bacterium]